MEFLRANATRPSLRPYASYAGLHVATQLDAAADETVVCRALAEEGIAVGGLFTYLVGPPATSGLVFGFGQTDTTQLEAALEIAGNVLGALSSSS
jgi:DNA-binding transcriptional MocR family regulator